MTPLLALALACVATGGQRGPLDSKGQMHIPIGLPNTLDELKTFVEAEGSFSPGFGSFGVYFWVYDSDARKLTAPTMDGVICEHGLADAGQLIPWSRWKAGDVEVKTEVCHVVWPYDTNSAHIVAARVHLTNATAKAQSLALYAAIRPLGPAGWAIKKIGFSEGGDTIALSDTPSFTSSTRPTAWGAVTNDTIGDFALRGGLPPSKKAVGSAGDCSAAMRFDLKLEPGQGRTFGFVAPVKANRRVSPHHWDGTNTWAQFDENPPNATNGIPVPYVGLGFCRSLKVDDMFKEASTRWNQFQATVKLTLPDTNWTAALRTIPAHLALTWNEGAPDVSVVNYNVFNRDAVYAINVLQKWGVDGLASKAIDHLLSHPFGGRIQPEADNPGQLLWIMAEHWKLTRDTNWYHRVYGARVRRLADMIHYYRATPGPHFVSASSLDTGRELPPAQQLELKPGACDGFHPEYTEAFDVAGIQGAIDLAEGSHQPTDRARWQHWLAPLKEQYRARFETNLARAYGSYSVLWPCRVYPLDAGAGHDAFKKMTPQAPESWRYFPLATAHQGLLAGQREVGHGTVDLHLRHPQMRGWFAFDEGGESGVGGWNHVRTTWPQGKTSVAMPHAWAIAELWLLMRDCLVYEDGESLVLLAGVPADWFNHRDGFRIENLPTHFGPLTLLWKPKGETTALVVHSARPPKNGYRIRLPKEVHLLATADGNPLEPRPNGELVIPGGTRVVNLQ